MIYAILLIIHLKNNKKKYKKDFLILLYLINIYFIKLDFFNYIYAPNP